MSSYHGVLTVSGNLAVFLSDKHELIGGIRVLCGWESDAGLLMRYGRGTAWFTTETELLNAAPFYVAVGDFDTATVSLLDC